MVLSAGFELFGVPNPELDSLSGRNLLKRWQQGFVLIHVDQPPIRYFSCQQLAWPAECLTTFEARCRHGGPYLR